tara:strand:+ start:12133 stop:14055 length:1923 start_codon:yes stop_codon:yes gene_type:complete
MVEMNIYYVGLGSYNNAKSSTIGECIEYLKDKTLLSLDIETTRKFGGRFEKEGLDPYLSEIVMLQIGDKERQYVIDYRFVDTSSMKDILSDPAKTFVGQNIKFEYKHLLHRYGVRLSNLYDTMVVEQILFNGHKVQANLEALNLKYLNIQVNKDIRLGFLEIKDRPFTDEEIEYGAQDVLYPLLIRDKQLLDVKNKQVENCVALEMLFIPVLGDLEYKGMHFNQKVWTNTYNENLELLQAQKTILNEYVVRHHRSSYFVKQQLDMFDQEITCNINWGSPLQVIGLFKHMKICPQAVSKTTKKLTYTVNASVLMASLNTINKDIPKAKKDLILNYLKYRELRQSCTTFGIAFFKYVNPITNRLHSNFRQILNTGRISSSGPNLQNIPSDDRFRSAFDAPDGCKIVNADYSGQETILLANKSLEPNMIKLITDGGDMHCFVTRNIYPELKTLSDSEIKSQHKDKRQIAKAAGFATQYGGTGYTISNNLGIPEKQGNEIYNAYFKAFPVLKEYFNRVQAESLAQGYILIDDITQRKFWFNPPKSPKDKGKIERAALNYCIQGAAGSLTKYATILFRRWIIDSGLYGIVNMTNVVHDEINVEVPEEHAELVAKNLEDCMKKGAEKWCLTVPMNADAVITTHWAH